MTIRPNRVRKQPQRKAKHIKRDWVEVLKVVLTAISAVLIFAAGIIQLVRDLKKDAYKPQPQVEEPISTPPQVNDEPESSDTPRVRQPKGKKKPTPKRRSDYAHGSPEPKGS